jgi:anion-transporting  ArsA/GET3 family ATPase
LDPVQFFTATRLVIVAGKGGVGKTTVSAALARAAALVGLSTLVVEVEGRSGLPAMFGRAELGYDEIVLSSGSAGGGLGDGVGDGGSEVADVRARTVTPDEALLEYLRDHGLSRISKRLVSSGALDVVATAAPGIKDILLLGKVKQLERSETADLIVLDAPAAGHAITFLQSARGLLDAVRVGPINAQARDVLDLLEDHRRCQVVLVTIPEETPVNEAVETAFSLEDRVGVSLGPIVVNGVYPDIDALDVDVAAAAADAGVTLRPGEDEALRAAAEFRSRRRDLQREQIDRLGDQLPLPQLRMPFLFTAALGPPEVDVLAQALLADIGALSELPT